MNGDSVLPSGQSKAKTTDQCQERVPKFMDYLRVFSYATKWDMSIYFVGCLASIGSGIMMPLMNIIFGKLVGQFTAQVKQPSTVNDFQDVLNKQTLYIMGLFFSRWFLSSLNRFCFRIIGIRLSAAVRLHYVSSLFRQSIQVIDSMPIGMAATAITATSNTLQIGISERLGVMLQSTSTVCAAVVVAFIWSWNITLITSSLLIYVLIVLSICAPPIVKGLMNVTKKDSEAIATASEAIEGVRLVTACGAQSLVSSRYAACVNEALRLIRPITPIIAGQLGLVYFGIFGGFSLAFWYGTQRFAAGAIDNPGVVLVVIMSTMMIFLSIQNIVIPLMDIKKAIVAACELFTVIDAPSIGTGCLRPNVLSEDLIFENVVFEYPNRPGVTVLKDLNLRIPAGKNTALVGTSGSGKSTIVALLERWYSLRETAALPKVIHPENENIPSGKVEETTADPDGTSKTEGDAVLSGSITIGGFDLNDLDLKWWRTKIGLVQQEPFLFNDTIFNNVAFGLIGTQFEDETEVRKREMVLNACKEVYADRFIAHLPDGYDTRVGDGGTKLSGGQKQRLAIARSIVKRPQIIILDEATSAIDVRSEEIIQHALEQICRNRTTITIAHRLSTIQKADNIVILRDGRVAEQGTHRSLLDNEFGLYRGLVEAQSLQMSGKDESSSLQYVAEEQQTKEATNDHSEIATTITSEAGRKKTHVFLTIMRVFIDRHSQWRFYLGIIVSSMCVGAGTPIQAWLMAKVINIFVLPRSDIKQESDFLGAMWLTLAASIGIACFLKALLSIHLQYLVSAEYKLQYLSDLLHQEISFFERDSNSHGTLTSNIAGDAKQVEEIFGLNLAFLLSGFFTVVGCVIISQIFSWNLGLVALLVTMPMMLITGFWKTRHEIQFETMNASVFMESSQFATEAIGAIRTVSSLTMESLINQRYHELLEGHIKSANRKAQGTAALFGLSDSITLGCQALIFWYGGRLLIHGKVSLESFFVCLMATIQGAEEAARCLSMTPNVARAAAALQRMADTHESRIPMPGLNTSTTMPNTENGVNISFFDVTFKYPTRDISILNGLNLQIPQGQYAAFVGPSGSGKTTLVSLLERFYDLEPGQGVISFNNINVNDFDVYDYRKKLSLVEQEPKLFRGTVRDNILLGVEDNRSITEDRIHEVCRDAFIHDFIISLPEGYNTEVGHKGIAMSGGQKQRIAIARAMIRNPQILLLDEATSALDSESEKIIQASIERVREGRTIIAVAHRLSTIQNADVIFVMDDGKIVESGSHSDLVEKRGIYWQLCRKQALDG